MRPATDRAGDVVTILRGWATDQGPTRLSRLLVAHNAAGFCDGLATMQGPARCLGSPLLGGLTLSLERGAASDSERPCFAGPLVTSLLRVVPSRLARITVVPTWSDGKVA